MKTQTLLLLLLGSIVFGSFSLSAQERDLEKQVERYISWMTKAKNPKIWDASLRLEKLGDEAVPLIKRRIRTLPEEAQVGCAKALIQLGEMDYGVQFLMEIIKEGKSLDAKMEAASLVGVFGDFDLETDLDEALENTFNPYLKIALAKTIWQVSRSPKAARLLKSYLEVDNEKLQFEAALALGEIHNIEAAKPLLNKLRDEPTSRGRMAKLLLEQQTLVARYERLLDSQGGTPSKETTKVKYPLVDEVIDKVREYHTEGDQFSQIDLIDAAVKGIVDNTDMHSAFWTEKEWNEFVKTIVDEEYVGIGVYVGFQQRQFTIIAPIYSGPAYRAGIRSMDKVLEVNGWSTYDKSMDEIIKKMKGTTGSSARLKIYREGWSQAREIEVPREKIKVDSLLYEMLPEKIGYMRLTQFGRKATSEMEKALNQLEKQGMKALVLDLRGNAGGWLQTAVDILDKFVQGQKLLVYSEGRHPKKGLRSDYYSKNEGTHPNFPMVVLVDESSASASEIVAGTLQYYKRAVIVGMQTYGKGSVQEPIPLISRPGARIKLTIAKYYLPDGRSIHNKIDKDGNIVEHKGVHPDIKVSYENWETWKNEELQKLQEEKKLASYLQKYYLKNLELFEELAQNDHLSTEKYPEFAQWYKSLETRASEQDVRMWLRSELRRRVSDDRGQQYSCDYIEDFMLQRAIKELVEKLGMKLEDSSAFGAFADKFK